MGFCNQASWKVEVQLLWKTLRWRLQEGLHVRTQMFLAFWTRLTPTLCCCLLHMGTAKCLENPEFTPETIPVQWPHSGFASCHSLWPHRALRSCETGSAFPFRSMTFRGSKLCDFNYSISLVCAGSQQQISWASGDQVCAGWTCSPWLLRVRHGDNDTVGLII